jgi:hypothetical protein
VRSRVVYHLLVLALGLAWVWVLLQVAGSDNPGWKMVLPTLVYISFPKEWVSEKISRQPRVDPFGRREGNPAAS